PSSALPGLAGRATRRRSRPAGSGSGAACGGGGRAVALRSGRRALHLAAVDAGCARRAGRVHLGRTPAASLVASCFAARFVDPNSGGAARLPGSAAPARSLAARCLAIGGTPGTGAARWQRDPTPGTLLVCDRGVQRTPLADRSHRAQSPARRLGTAHRLATGVAGGDRDP